MSGGWKSGHVSPPSHRAAFALRSVMTGFPPPVPTAQTLLEGSAPCKCCLCCMPRHVSLARRTHGRFYIPSSAGRGTQAGNSQPLMGPH